MRYARMIMEAEAPKMAKNGPLDHNLSASSIRNRTFGDYNIDLGDMELPYGDHFGNIELRQLIAEQSAENIAADDIMVTTGASGSLFIVSTSLLQSEDQIIVGFPNYATNFETPLAIGCNVVLHEQLFDERFRIDIDRLEKQVTEKTRFISLTFPHNPSGVVISEAELEQIVKIAEERDIYLLFDETYRDLTYNKKLPCAASLSEKAISVSSMSKVWGVPGIRIGWLITRSKTLLDKFIAAREQISITGSVVDEKIAIQILKQRDTALPKIRDDVKNSLALFRAWIEAESMLEWVEPGAGVIAVVRLKGANDEEMTRFYETLRLKYRVMVAPGYWFKLPKNMMRIGFGWSAPEETSKALTRVSECIVECFG